MMEADPASGYAAQERPHRDVPLRVSQVFSACTFCKARKIKCDGVAPACGCCTKFGRASTCSLSTGGSHGRDYPTYLQNKIRKLQSDLERRRAEGPGDPTSSGSPESPPDFNIIGEPQQQRTVIDTLIADIGALPILASSYPSTTDGPTLSTVVLAAASKSPLSLVTPSNTGEEGVTIDGRPFLPKQSTALKLAQHYIDQVYPRLPFFSIQGFWAQFHHVYAAGPVSLPGQSVSPPQDPTTVLSPSRLDLNNSSLNTGYSYFTVLLVLAIATSSLSRSADSMISNQAQRLFHAALQFRESAILPNTIIGVQSLLFLIQFATLNPSTLDAWYLIGVGMRNCVDLGLHQDPQPLSSISASLLETRRRLWWSMYSFDRSMSLGCGRPTEISDAVIDAKLPAFRIESNASEIAIEGYLQRYRALQLQSEIYATLNRVPNQAYQDSANTVAALLQRLSAWREANSPLHSQTLVDSEWLMGKLLLFRPCRLLPERTYLELSELWSAALGFTALYRKLVESNSIFYVQIACEKVYWTGLAMLYSYWRLRSGDDGLGISLRPLDLWMAIKDITYILRTLSERWEDGKILSTRFDETSGRGIELLESGMSSETLAGCLPSEVVNFAEYASLTSLWAAGTEHSNYGMSTAATSDELQELVSDMI